MTRWRIGGAALLSLVIALVLGLRERPAQAPIVANNTVHETVVRPSLNTQAPPPPPLPASTETSHRVVATLPDSLGRTGRAVRDVDREARVAKRPAFTPKPLPLDPIRMALQTFGASPIDFVDTLSMFDPQYGITAISIEAMWGWDDEQAGLQVPTERTDRIRAALEQILRNTDDTSASWQARSMLLEMDIAQAPPEARSQLVWDKFVTGLRGNAPFPGFIAGLYVVNPDISLEDHALFASLYDTHPPDWSDLFLRDALAKDEAEWTRYWWNHLEISSDRPTASEEWRSRWKANRDQLAGAVGDLIGEPRSWQDGLRVAAVSCARSTDIRPFSTEIVYRIDRWHRTDNALPDAFESCIYTSSEPAPAEAQHALLIVQRPEKHAAAILPP